MGRISKKPLYRRLAQELSRRIARGDFPVGSLLPTEAELCRQNRLSRHTVREALRQLQELGMIERRTRVGTRVIAAQPVIDYRPVAASAEDIGTFVAGTRIVRASAEEITADRDLAARIGVRPGSRWFRLSGPRVRRAGPREPLCWSEQYLRADVPGRTRLIRGEYGAEDMRNQTIEQEVSAAVLDSVVAAALAAGAGEPALVVTRRHYDDRGDLMFVGVHTHPAERYSFKVALRRDGTARRNQRS